VQRALKQVRERFSALKRLPENGLIIFASEQICELLEPPMPVRSSYVCGKHFATQELRELFLPAKEHGFVTFCPKEVVMWKNAGTKRTILKVIEVDLQTNSARGGQSAPRFGRIRQGHRLALLKSIAEETLRLFGTKQPVVAGSGLLAEEFCKSINCDLVRIAATERSGALKETTIKGAAVLADNELAVLVRNQEQFELQLVTGAAMFFGNEIAEAAEISNLRLVYSDGSVPCDLCNELLLVLDLAGYGGLVGVPFF